MVKASVNARVKWHGKSDNVCVYSDDIGIPKAKMFIWRERPSQGSK